MVDEIVPTRLKERTQLTSRAEGVRGDCERHATTMLDLTSGRIVPKDHPLRQIKLVVDSVQSRISLLFDELWASGERPSFPHVHVLKSSPLMASCTSHPERHFCDELRDNVLFKWFLDSSVEEGATPMPSGRVHKEPRAVLGSRCG